MDSILDKVWGVLITVTTALLGFFMYHQKKVNDRLVYLEQEVSKHSTEIAVVREALNNLKEDTQEIKEASQLTLKILAGKGKK